MQCWCTTLHALQNIFRSYISMFLFCIHRGFLNKSKFIESVLNLFLDFSWLQDIFVNYWGVTFSPLAIPLLSKYIAEFFIPNSLIDQVLTCFWMFQFFCSCNLTISMINVEYVIDVFFSLIIAFSPPHPHPFSTFLFFSL